jgi:hypothetical protein
MMMMMMMCLLFGMVLFLINTNDGIDRKDAQQTTTHDNPRQSTATKFTGGFRMCLR